MYKNFLADLERFTVWKDNKKFISESMQKLGEQLSRDTNRLIEQLVDAESRRARLVFLLSITKAERDRAVAVAWKQKPPSKHGEAKRNESEVNDETKDYHYMVKLFEGFIECIDIRLPLGKRLLEIDRQ